MNIVVTGSIAYDYLMRFPGKFADHLLQDQLHQISVSFLVEDMTRHWGGIAPNIAFSMALLGLKPKVMGTAGRDFPPYRDWLESNGVDTSTVRQIDEVFTASFFANTDVDNNQIASFYSGAMAYARDYSLADACGDMQPDLVIVSPNDPQAMANITEECRDQKIRFIYDPSQQVARLSGDEILHGLRGAYVLIANAYEMEIISQKTGKRIDELRQMVDIVVVTQGERGAHVYHGADFIETAAFPPKEIKDPTGVGDAFRAGLIYGLMHDLPLQLSTQIGSLCATYVLEHIGPQSHHYTPAEFVARFRERYDDGGLLDVLEMC